MNNNTGRKYIAIKNASVSIVARIVEILSSFLISRYFIRFLGIELKGLNGVFDSFLSLLQLSELGFGSAIGVILYQPIIDNDKEKINSIINYYKRIYRIVFFAILGLGVCAIPLIPNVAKTSFSNKYVILIYLLQLLTSASTYLFSYYRTMLIYNKREYVVTILEICSNVIFSVAKIVSIVIYKNYFLYLLFIMAQKILPDICVYFICKNDYPFIFNKTTSTFNETALVKNNVKDIAIGKIGGWIYSSTDNILISYFVGVIEVGFLTNFYSLKGMLGSIVMSISGPIQPMIGLYIREEKNVQKSLKLFYNYSFLRWCIANISAVGFIMTANDIVSLWIGSEYTVSIYIVILMAIDIYIGMAHGPTGEYIESLGLFKDNKYISLIGGAINLFFSIVFCKLFGSIGVLIGTAIAQLYYWSIRCYVVFNRFFKDGILKYIMLEIKYLLITIVEILILNYVFSFNYFIYSGILSIITKCVICIFTSMFIIIVFNFYTDEFTYSISMVKEFITTKRNNK